MTTANSMMFCPIWSRLRASLDFRIGLQVINMQLTYLLEDISCHSRMTWVGKYTIREQHEPLSTEETEFQWGQCSLFYGGLQRSKKLM